MQRARNLEPEFYAELNSGISETVQEQSMTLQEILERFKRGQSLPVGKSVYYDGDEDQIGDLEPDPTLDGSFDLVDADILNEQLSQAKQQRQSANGAKRRSAESREPKTSEGSERSVEESQGDRGEGSNAEVASGQAKLF